MAVIGAGFGGLGAALSLARRGYRVVVLERLNYPGGCAGTFARDGYRFDAGATLSSGLGDGQLFARWIRDLGLDVTAERLDPIVDFRGPQGTLKVPADRDAFIAMLVQDHKNPAGLRTFFDEQKRTADVVWDILDDPRLLPPFTPAALWTHLRRSPRYAALLPRLGRPLARVLRDHGLDQRGLLRTFLDASCQITLQCGVDEVEAPFAMATLDYYFRGTRHIRGGIGALAWALVEAIAQAGGSVRFADRLRGLERSNGAWRLDTRHGTLSASAVVANLLPQSLETLLGSSNHRLRWLASQVETGWGACMLYRVLRRPADAGPEARHIQIVQDPDQPLIEGNHLFCSISSADETERAAEGQATMTVSTHIRMRDLNAARVQEVQDRMRAGLEIWAPEWSAGLVHELPASPRTFERFTGRPGGYVGGVPRRAGWQNYRGLWPRPVAEDLYLVGDSVFPGQSTLATALGGHRVAELIHRTRRRIVSSA
ncbi:MAG: FAD-dependent oxidoreductase [Pirellulaceae bacterium]|nr:FAD-dependent oxidoreductase [Pirellulaceae bacterium]